MRVSGEPPNALNFSFASASRTRSPEAATQRMCPRHDSADVRLRHRQVPHFRQFLRNVNASSLNLRGWHFGWPSMTLAAFETRESSGPGRQDTSLLICDRSGSTIKYDWSTAGRGVPLSDWDLCVETVLGCENAHPLTSNLRFARLFHSCLRCYTSS